MIEKIYVSRDEVLHYPWLDSTQMDVFFDTSEILRMPMFRKTVAVLTENGIKKAGPEVIKKLNENSVFIANGPSDIRIRYDDKFL